MEERCSSTTSPAAAEELVESMAKRVVECLKEPRRASRVKVGGWSGIGRKRVMDHVAAALHVGDYKGQGEDDDDDFFFFFCGCVRVAFKPYIEFEIRRKMERVLERDLPGGDDVYQREMRRKMEQEIGMDLPGEENVYWREICMALKWKPFVLMVDDLRRELNDTVLGIPRFVTDAQGVAHSFLKLLFTTHPYDLYVDADRKFEDKFYELPDDVALRMILCEAHSSATSTVKEYLPIVIKGKFESKKENMTSMALPSLAPLHQDFFRMMLTAKSVIQCLFSSILFKSIPQYYLKSEILLPSCFDNIKATLLLQALLLDLQNRDLMYVTRRYSGFDVYDSRIYDFHIEGFKINENVYRKLAAAWASSSSSSGITTRLIQGYLVGPSRRLERVDMAEWSQDLTRISFADNRIKEVLLPPPSAAPANFPNLSTLILQENPRLEEIPDDVFRYMPNLRILDLSYCGIRTLPSTLSSLWNLRMLFLRGCTNLQTIETTGLDNLEALNLDYCPLPTLHKALWCHLCSLKHFSFEDGLQSLRELQLLLKNVKVFDNFDEDLNFGPDLHSSAPRVDTLHKCSIAILYPKEEEELERRRTRDAHLLSSDQFPYKDIHAQFDRHVDTVDQYPIVAAAAGVDKPHEKCLEINGGEGLWSLYTLSLMFRPQLLSLHNYQHAQAGIWPIPELQTCYIKYCRDMEYAFNSPNEKNDLWNLNHLETLRISSLTKLSAICNNRFEQNESFLLLKSIYLEYCPNLLVLFPVTIRLPNLEVMEITFCTRLGKLFTQHTAGEIVLPKLKRLRLCGLPKLTSICEEGHLPMLQKLEVRGCWNLKNVPIFPSSDSGPDVAGKVVLVVRGEEGWWKNVQGGFKKVDHIDFKIAFDSAAPKHIPQRWKRGPRRRRPLLL